ncbi:uncharacterized protein LOC119357702 [Triticum dicoccoides]|uniref:uncharacterized protein LOC119357702 n=1 Tax=Triticum dicoccoides TaxID=85692 RepID=UPI00188EE4A4|nr:uncharacterized protein LOC119357702 [Triticum dicoccoides]
MAPRTGNMVPLEYLVSLEVADEVCEYAWGEQIMKDVISEVDTFQKKKKKALLDGVFKKIWVGSCLPLLAIIYMDHLDFPESSLSTHQINYSLPRASHVTDDDFDFVMLHDKSRLSLNPHIYGARPFRALDTTPYAIQAPNYKDQSDQQPYIQQTETDSTEHPAGDMHHQVPTLPIKQSKEPSAFILPILQRHSSKWAEDISKATSRLTKLHAKRMNELAQDVIAATKNHNPIPPTYSSPPRDVQDSSAEKAQNNGTKATPDTRFWQEATAYADESKLLVPEDKFDASNCLREFNTAYHEGSLKSKDLNLLPSSIGYSYGTRTGNMVPLEYLGSLEVADEVCEYAWGEQILKDVMSEVNTFQKKKKKALLDGVFKKIWVGSCLPLLAIIYIDHLDFPESSLSTHRINYSLPRISHVTDDDFDFVMLHDKSRLSLIPHIYGARPFRALDTTPYAIQAPNYKDQPDQQPYIQQTETDSTEHPAGDMHHQVPTLPIKQTEVQHYQISLAHIFT